MSPNSCSGKLPPSGRAALTLAETISQSRPQFLTGFIKLTPLSSVWPQHRAPMQMKACSSLIHLCCYMTQRSFCPWSVGTGTPVKEPEGTIIANDNIWDEAGCEDSGTVTRLWLALHTVHYKPDYINHVPSGKVDKTLMELHGKMKEAVLIS